MRKFPCAVLSVGKFPHVDKEETFFLWKRTLLWSEIFLDNYLFIGPKNVKTSLKV